MSEGTKGGDVNRPASVPEVKKLPRVKCVLCGIVQAKPAIENARCRNEVACQIRRDRQQRAKAK